MPLLSFVPLSPHALIPQADPHTLQNSAGISPGSLTCWGPKAGLGSHPEYTWVPAANPLCHNPS